MLGATNYTQQNFLKQVPKPYLEPFARKVGDDKAASGEQSACAQLCFFFFKLCDVVCFFSQGIMTVSTCRPRIFDRTQHRWKCFELNLAPQCMEKSLRHISINPRCCWLKIWSDIRCFYWDSLLVDSSQTLASVFVQNVQVNCVFLKFTYSICSFFPQNIRSVVDKIQLSGLLGGYSPWHYDTSMVPPLIKQPFGVDESSVDISNQH